MYNYMSFEVTDWASLKGVLFMFCLKCIEHFLVSTLHSERLGSSSQVMARPKVNQQRYPIPNHDII